MWISRTMGVYLEEEAPSLHAHAGQVSLNILFLFFLYFFCFFISSFPFNCCHLSCKLDSFWVAHLILHSRLISCFYLILSYSWFSHSGNPGLDGKIFCASQPSSKKKACDNLQERLPYVWIQPLYMT